MTLEKGKEGGQEGRGQQGGWCIGESICGRACERASLSVRPGVGWGVGGGGVQAAHGQRLPASVSLRDVADCLVALHGGTPPPRDSGLPEPAAGSVKGTGGSGGEGGGNLLGVLHSLG